MTRFVVAAAVALVVLAGCTGGPLPQQSTGNGAPSFPPGATADGLNLTTATDATVSSFSATVKLDPQGVV